MSTVPACAKEVALFDSLHPADHQFAKKLCATCPLLALCRNRLNETRRQALPGCGPEGTWAGELVTNKKRGKRAQKPVYTRDSVAAICHNGATTKDEPRPLSWRSAAGALPISTKESDRL